MDDWRVIATSPITGAQLWMNGDETQVAACNAEEEPTHASALVSGVALESRQFVTEVFMNEYFYEYQYDF